MPRPIVDRSGRHRVAHRVAILEGTGARSPEWFGAVTIVVLATGAALNGPIALHQATGVLLLVVTLGLQRLRRHVAGRDASGSVEVGRR
jgi:hypothetical protein